MIGIAHFGNRDRLRYVQDTRITTQSGQQLCLMAKTTLTSFIFPLALSKEYVWGFVTARDQAKNVTYHRTDTYVPIANGEIGRLQKSGHLPSPLPLIKYGIGDVVAVCIGWLMLLILVAGGLAKLTGH